LWRSLYIGDGGVIDKGSEYYQPSGFRDGAGMLAIIEQGNYSAVLTIDTRLYL
jgi:hypothetical protein